MTAMTDSPCLSQISCLSTKLTELFQLTLPWEERRDQIVELLNRVDLVTTEMNKYVFFDSEKAYTRNLVATDDKNFTLLILCWNAGKESKIHDHPCDGCFIKTIRGCVRETRYNVSPESNEIEEKCTKFYSEGQVSYMSNDLGLHKIGNPCPEHGAITLHLYTPPFGSCKVWSDAGIGQLDKYEMGKIGFYSVYGQRTPHLEGKPGLQAKLLLELASKQKI